MSKVPMKYDVALMEKLTPREIAFINHPQIMVNAEQAAIDAGYSEGWARGNAATKRKQLMYYILPTVKKRWAEKGVSLERIQEELAAIAFSDETEYYDRVEDPVNGETILVGKDPTLLPEEMRRAIQRITFDTLVLPDGTSKQIWSFALHDKKEALQTLTKMLGGFDPRTREPQDAEARRKQAELFDWMKPEELDTIVKIYRRAEKRQREAATDAVIIEGKK